MKRPSHGTAIAYLALFIALSSGAYAATQLPKNSVGSRQLKKNAVTTTKLKNGAVTEAKIGNDAVTGAKVSESTLGQVPSAATAGSAATATSAGSAANASALDGIPSSGFLKTSHVYFGASNPKTPTNDPIFTVPGQFAVTTSGEDLNLFNVRFENVSATRTWFFHARTTLLFLEPGKFATMEFATLQETIVGVDADDPSHYAVIECAFRSGSPGSLFCTGTVSPAV